MSGDTELTVPRSIGHEGWFDEYEIMRITRHDLRIPQISITSYIQEKDKNNTVKLKIRVSDSEFQLYIITGYL